MSLTKLVGSLPYPPSIRLPHDADSPEPEGGTEPIEPATVVSQPHETQVAASPMLAHLNALHEDVGHLHEAMMTFDAGSGRGALAQDTSDLGDHLSELVQTKNAIAAGQLIPTSELQRLADSIGDTAASACRKVRDLTSDKPSNAVNVLRTCGKVLASVLLVLASTAGGALVGGVFGNIPGAVIGGIAGLVVGIGAAARLWQATPESKQVEEVVNCARSMHKVMEEMIKLDPELKVPEMLQALVQHYDPAPVLDIQPLALGMLV